MVILISPLFSNGHSVKPLPRLLDYFAHYSQTHVCCMLDKNLSACSMLDKNLLHRYSQCSSLRLSRGDRRWEQQSISPLLVVLMCMQNMRVAMQFGRKPCSTRGMQALWWRQNPGMS